MTTSRCRTTIAAGLAIAAVSLAPTDAETARANKPEAAGDTKGATALTIAKKPARLLRRRGIRAIAIRPGLVRRDVRRARFPVDAGRVGAIARLRHAGELRLLTRAGGRRRRVRIRRLRATLSAGRGHLTARVGGRQLTLARLRGIGQAPFNPTTGEVALAGARVRLTSSARRALRDALGGRRVPVALGRLGIEATVEIEPPAYVEPEPLERPAGALDVESASLSWRVRESFICYIHAQGGPGASAHGGAVAEPPVAYPPPNLSVPCAGAPQTALSYTFSFAEEALVEGWFDPGSEVAALRWAGTVSFVKDIFAIDLDASGPEVELAGEGSRLVHTFTDNAADPADPRRAVTADLQQGGAEVVTEPDGDLVYTYERIPGSVPDGPTASQLAGFYLPGQSFGWVTVTFTVPEGDAP